MPLLFLHGLLGSGEDWIPVVQFLKNRTCIAIDLPGHGNSPFTEQFDEELTDIPRFHLIGYSMGGRLALAFANRHPHRVASLTLLGAHFGLPESERIARLEADRKWAQLLLELPIDEFLNRWYDQPIFQTLDKNRMRTMRQKQNAQSLAQSLLHYSLGRQPIYEPKGNLLVGEWDSKFRDLYRNLNPIIIPKAGHAAHLEQPEIVAQHIERFI